MLWCCLFILKFASFVIFSLLWLRSLRFLLFISTKIQTFALAKLFRSGRSFLNFIGCVFCWFWEVLIGSVVEEQVLILLDSSEPKEVMSRDAVVTVFTLFLKAIVLCLLSWFWLEIALMKLECANCFQKNHVCDLRGSLRPESIHGLFKQLSLITFS